MNHPIVQQELLLRTRSQFALRQFELKQDSGIPNRISAHDCMRDASWHGYLPALLPEAFRSTEHAEALHLWEIRESDEILSMELGNTPKPVDSITSINPHLFLPHFRLN